MWIHNLGRRGMLQMLHPVTLPFQQRVSMINSVVCTYIYIHRQINVHIYVYVCTLSTAVHFSSGSGQAHRVPITTYNISFDSFMSLHGGWKRNFGYTLIKCKRNWYSFVHFRKKNSLWGFCGWKICTSMPWKCHPLHNASCCHSIP